jgi:hypothetical protein
MEHPAFFKTITSIGCGGLQPSVLFSTASYVGTDPARSVNSVQGHRLAISSRWPTIKTQLGVMDLWPIGHEVITTLLPDDGLTRN